MKKRYYFLLMLILGVACQAMAQTTTSVDTLHDAFLGRPSSIIKEEPRWNWASTNLFTDWISNGLYGLYGPQPQVMLDGIPVNANFFGWQNLNMLPLFVQNINKAASRFAPGVYNQTAAGAGLINFKTEQLKQGFTAHAFYYSGNETKDPGPRAYDSLRTSPNIDRWGPDRGIFLAYTSNLWFAKGFYLYRFNKPNDLAQNLRLHITNSLLDDNTEYVNYPIFIESKSALLEGGFTSSHWQFRSRFIIGNNDDFLFLQPFGRELPVQTEYRQLAFQSKYNSGTWSFKTRYLFDYKTIQKSFEQHIYIFDWKQKRHTISLSGRYEAAIFSISPGVIFEKIDTRAPGLQQNDNKLLTLFLKGDLYLGNRFIAYSNGFIDFHNNFELTSASFKIGANIAFTDRWRFNPEIYYSELAPVRQHSFAYWVKRGYTFADRLNISFNYPVNVLENEVLSVKLASRFSFGDFTLHIVPQFIKNYRLNIPWQVVRYNEFTHTRPGRFTVSQHSGERFKLLAVFEHSFSRLLQQSLSVYLQNTISGSKRYRNYFKQIPDTKIKYQFDINPVNGLRFSVNAIYRSPTTWVELKALDGKEYRLPIGIPIGQFSRSFNTTTPAFINIGLSVRKWFSDRHISLQFGLQNILDQEVRTHPIGASLYPIINFKLSLRY